MTRDGGDVGSSRVADGVEECAEDILQDAPCGFISARPDGTILWVNNTILHWTGFDRTALLSGERFQDLLTTPGSIFYQTHIAPLLRLQGAVKEISCQFRREGRPPLPALVNFAVKADPEGNPLLMRITVFDATDRTRYEQELRLARNQAEQLSAIVKSSPDAIVSIGLDLLVRTWNTGATSLFGYDEAEAIGRNIDDLIVPEDRREERARFYSRVASGHEAVRLETLRRRKDSGLVPVEINASPLFDGNGNVDAVAIIFRDITERVRSAALLQGSEARYRSVVEGSLHGIVIQQSGRIVYANAAMARLFGYVDASEMIGLRTFEDLVIEEDRPLLRARTAAVYRGERVNPHPGWRGSRNDGTTIWVSSTAHVSEWQGQPAVTSFYSDITHQKRIEMAIRESEAKLQLAVSIAKLGLGTIDYTTDTITLDSEAARIFELPANIALPRKAAHSRFHADFGPLIAAKIAAALDVNGDGFMAVDHAIVMPDESTRWVSARKQVQFETDAMGTKHATSGLLIVRDISDQKLAEERLRASQAAYRHALKAARSGAWEWDVEKDRVTWSPELGELTGAVPGEYPRTLAQFLEFVPEEERNEMAVGIRHRLDTGSDSYEIETRLRRRDGTFKWARGAGRIERNQAGVAVRVVGLVSDIHELREAQDGVRASEARLRRILDDVLVLVGTLALDGTLTEANAMATAIAGLRREDVVGKPFWDCFWWCYAFDVQQGVREAVRRAAAGEVVRHDVDIRIAGNQRITVDFQLAPVFGEGGNIIELVASAVDITARKRAEEKIKRLMAEVNHRSKNLLGVVLAVARQTARQGSPDAFVDRLSDRIAGLAASQDLLVKNHWQGVELSDLVQAQLAHFADLFGTRVLVDGPRLGLTPAAAQGIGMALHELATNAAKYGALSNLEGRVSISWHFVDANPPAFSMSWREEGGPTVATPARSGFGRLVIESMVEAAVNGSVEMDYLESGFSWTLTATTEGVLEPQEVGDLPGSGFAIPSIPGSMKTSF